ncbi:MAG: DUF1403 family protein [Rhodobacteraceae bacterium]|nr:DUF1403 family protein [Paracoccaceae bacterium]
MRVTRSLPHDSPADLPWLPDWLAAVRPDTLEDAAFCAGAALSVLHRVVASADAPQALWRDRLALGAAEACAGLAGRPDREAELRDAVHLLRPGETSGPAGEIFRLWRQAVARPLSVAALGRALPGLDAAQIARGLAVRPGSLMARVADTLAAVLAGAPRAEAAALILADAALARAMGWDHVVPLLAVGLKPRDLRQTGDDLRLACHRAVLSAARIAVPLAADLARRADRLRAVTPQLRAKGAAAAVERFLNRDALPATGLTDLMSDRAARRLCDRLVGLGALRELTGRETFRLYGV